MQESATTGSDGCCTTTSRGRRPPRCPDTTVPQTTSRTDFPCRSGPGTDSSPRPTTSEQRSDGLDLHCGDRGHRLQPPKQQSPIDEPCIFGEDQGAGSGAACSELNAWTPASLSPSNGVIGPLPAPRQKSSPVESANQKPTSFSSVRTRCPLSRLDEKASATISLNVFCVFP